MTHQGFDLEGARERLQKRDKRAMSEQAEADLKAALDAYEEVFADRETMISRVDYDKALDEIDRRDGRIAVLRLALKEAIQFVPEGVVACGGDKCRRPNCESCWMEPKQPNWSVITAALSNTQEAE